MESIEKPLTYNNSDFKTKIASFSKVALEQPTPWSEIVDEGIDLLARRTLKVLETDLLTRQASTRGSSSRPTIARFTRALEATKSPFEGNVDEILAKQVLTRSIDPEGLYKSLEIPLFVGPDSHKSFEAPPSIFCGRGSPISRSK